MPRWRGADSGNMVAFPAEFPFNRRQAEAPVPPVELADTVVEPEMQEAPPEAVAPAVGPVEHAVTMPAVAEPVAAVTPPEITPAAAAAPVVSVIPASAPARLIERRKVRRDSMMSGAMVRLDNFHGPPLKVALMDISVAGARFRSAQPVDCGEKAQIRIEVGPLRWTTRLRIVHCEREADGTHTVGCAFLRTELLRPWPATAA